MLRGIFMPPGATKEQVDYYVELFKKVRETPEWKDLMRNGAFNHDLHDRRRLRQVGRQTKKSATSADEGSRLPRRQLIAPLSRRLRVAAGGSTRAWSFYEHAKKAARPARRTASVEIGVAAGHGAVRRDRRSSAASRSASAGASKVRGPDSSRSISALLIVLSRAVNLSHVCATMPATGCSRNGAAPSGDVGRDPDRDLCRR